MALYTVVKALVDSLLPDNITQLIDPAEHRQVEKAIIDAAGAAQVYVNPAVTDNPGTPENPRAYIALPGTYTNFSGLTVTAPLGVLKWDGTTWTVTQITIPSGHNYFKCKTTAAYTAGTNVTSIAIEMMAGGWTALAGQWVHLVNRRTGASDYVQLKANITGASTTLSVVSRVLQADLPIGSIVEANPNIGMMWHTETLVGDEVNNYVDLPSTWLLPPVEANNKRLYIQLLFIRVNGIEARWTSEDPPDAPNKYNLHASNRKRVIFEDILSVLDEIDVSYWQPRDLTISS